MPVSNASPLIYLAKIGILGYLRDFYEDVQIPQEVKEETVDRGMKGGYSDAFVIKTAIEEGWIKIDHLSEDNAKRAKIYAGATKIHIGEAEAIFLALQKGEKEILVDETMARDAARQLGLIPHGTIYIILKICNSGFITKEQTKGLLDYLIEKNFHVSARVYKKAMLALEREL